MWRTKFHRFNILFVLIALTMAWSASATSAWKTSIVKQKDYLVRNNKQKFELTASNLKPAIKQVKIHGDFEVVIFLANHVGTSQMVNVYSAAIYSKKEKKVIAILPYRYELVSGERSEDGQPQWSFKPNGVIEYRSANFPNKPRIFQSKK